MNRYLRIPRQAVSHGQSRLLAGPALHRMRPPVLSKQKQGLASHTRNFWWSSSPKAPTVQATEETAIEKTSTDVSSAPGDLPVKTAGSVEPSPPTTDLSVVPSELPIPDVSASSIASPLQYGDLAALGLAGWTPAGLCRWGMELLQVSTGMPWFWTIIGATAISRLILFPFTVRSMRSTAALAPHQEEIAELRVKMQEAQQSKDMLLLQSVALKQRMLYEKAGVSMVGMAIVPVVQLPVTLGMFFAVKKLCDFPLEQLKYSGVSFIPDLTVADPTGILPVAVAVAMNIQLTVGARDMMASPQAAHMVNLFRGLSLLGIPLMWNFSSGVLVYLMTSISVMTVQSLLLRQPAVRRALGIPIIHAKHEVKPATFMESIDYAKEWWQEKKKEQEAAIRTRRR